MQVPSLSDCCSQVIPNRHEGYALPFAGSGPFESAMSEEPPSPTLYLDRAGSAHFSLEGFTPAAHKAPGSPRFHQPSARPQELPLAVPGGLDYIPPALRYCLLRNACMIWIIAKISSQDTRTSGRLYAAPRSIPSSGSAMQERAQSVYLTSCAEDCRFTRTCHSVSPVLLSC